MDEGGGLGSSPRGTVPAEVACSKEEIAEKAGGRHRPCPRCGSDRVYRSRRRDSLERALKIFGLKIRRCHACNLRFTRFGGSVIVISDLRRILRRICQIALAVAGAALVLVAMLWLTTRQAAPPE